MYDKGADVIFAAAGGSGAGVFQAAEAASKFAIGVDSDQYNTPPTRRRRRSSSTSMLKRVDTAVYLLHQGLRDGQRKAGAHDLRPQDRRRRLLDVGRLRSTTSRTSWRRSRPTSSAARSRSRPSWADPHGSSSARRSVNLRLRVVPRAPATITVRPRPRRGGRALDEPGRCGEPLAVELRASPSGSPASSPTATSTCGCARGDDPCDRRRERRRQVDPDEDRCTGCTSPTRARSASTA